MKNATKTVSLVSATCLLGSVAFLSARESKAQGIPLPTPGALIRSLDLACHKTSQAEPPVSSLTVKHLNPVLQEMGWGKEDVYLGGLEQLCVPVAKNGVIPGRDVLPFIQYIDLACYAAKSEVSHQDAIRLGQLNPVVRELGMPVHSVAIRNLRQMCVPVQKRGTEIPDEVMRLVQHVDVACYEVDLPTRLPELPLKLTDLNPLFKESVEEVRTTKPEQLCVPVAKRVDIPPEIANIVRVIDFEKFAVEAHSIVLPRTLELRHLNPQFANAEVFKIEMFGITHLDLPVAKRRLIRE